MATLGSYRIAGLHLPWVVLPVLANHAPGAVVEEIILRGLVFRLAEPRLGTWWATALSAVLFGALHFGSPMTVPAALAAGLLLTAAYVWTRRLWLVMGIHFGWDFAQDGIFGFGPDAGLLRGDLTGPVALTGGDAGIEGSLLAFGVVALVGIALLMVAAGRGRIVAPGGASPMRG